MSSVFISGSVFLIIVATINKYLFLICILLISIPLLMLALINTAARCVTSITFNDEGIILKTLNNKNGTIVFYNNEFTNEYISFKNPCLENVILNKRFVTIHHFPRESKDRMKQLLKAHQMSNKLP